MKIKKGTFLITAGVILIMSALCLVSYNIYREKTAASFANRITAELSSTISGDKSQQGTESGDKENETQDKTPVGGSSETEIPNYVLNPKMEMPTVTVEGNEYIGILTIPSLNLTLPVMSEWSYPRLNVAPCRYSGSAYMENMVIAAHNYTCHFASLQYIEEGSEVSFTDASGNTFIYTVAFREVLDAASVEDMTCGDFPLTLFTCNNAGYARITVRCESAE